MNDESIPSPATRLRSLAPISVTGADAKSYLQGQLSFDMERLTPDYVELAAVSSAQGRVQAVVWLVQRTDAIVLLAPAEQLDTLVARLRKFILRAKVKIEPAASLSLGILSDASAPVPARGHLEKSGVSLIHWPVAASRGLLIAPATHAMPDDAVREAQWRLETIQGGLPQVFPATHETFVAQMLNLDLLQGISFDKGCYTGQEIIARMHFRGQVKRRMLRFAHPGPPPAPGTRVVCNGDHAGDVVDSAATENGSELLAVINLAQRDLPLAIDGNAGSVLEPLSLPYAVS
jgi:folate-binding protein YgfZ